jgi:hypothetical protein
MREYLFGAILAWYDDSSNEYHGLEDEEWIERVCIRTGMTREEYMDIVLEARNND